MGSDSNTKTIAGFTTHGTGIYGSTDDGVGVTGTALNGTGGRFIQTGNTTAPALTVTGGTGSGDLQQWLKSTGTALAKIDSSGSLTASGATLAFSSDTVGLIIRGHSAQTERLTEWQNSTGTAFMHIGIPSKQALYYTLRRTQL